MLELVYNFWVEMCPFFQGYDFIYIFLTAATIYVFIKGVFVLPSRILFGGANRRIWNE